MIIQLSQGTIGGSHYAQWAAELKQIIDQTGFYSLTSLELTQKTSQILIPPCPLRLCGSLRQAAIASTLFRNSCVSKS
ncbi:hypothetical protein IQ244_31970 [Nostoc sp. LEGE 06077]|nr:hypothetical protein [Nostoc sp. LEGE 06077]